MNGHRRIAFATDVERENVNSLLSESKRSASVPAAVGSEVGFLQCAEKAGRQELSVLSPTNVVLRQARVDHERIGPASDVIDEPSARLRRVVEPGFDLLIADFALQGPLGRGAGTLEANCFGKKRPETRREQHASAAKPFRKPEVTPHFGRKTEYRDDSIVIGRKMRQGTERLE